MRTSDICPTCSTFSNALCTIYNGAYLTTLDISTLESVESALIKIDTWASTITPPVLNMTTLTDVDLTGLANGMQLFYNSTSGNWEVSTPSSGGVSEGAVTAFSPQLVDSGGGVTYTYGPGSRFVFYTIGKMVYVSCKFLFLESTGGAVGGFLRVTNLPLPIAEFCVGDVGRFTPGTPSTFPSFTYMFVTGEVGDSFVSVIVQSGLDNAQNDEYLAGTINGSSYFEFTLTYLTS